MTDQEMDAFVQTVVNPPPKPWSNRSFARVMDAIRYARTNDVKTIHDILLTDKYFPEFRKEAKEEWQAESSYLHWQQFAAVEAAKRHDVFGAELISYYFGSLEELEALSSDEQIRKAALKLIQQGDLFVSILDASDKQSEIFKHKYVVQIITISGDTAIVEAAFMKPLAGSGFRIQFIRVKIFGKDVWLPVKQTGTWIS